MLGEANCKLDWAASTLTPGAKNSWQRPLRCLRVEGGKSGAVWAATKHKKEPRCSRAGAEHSTRPTWLAPGEAENQADSGREGGREVGPNRGSAN